VNDVGSIATKEGHQAKKEVRFTKRVERPPSQRDRLPLKPQFAQAITILAWRRKQQKVMAIGRNLPCERQAEIIEVPIGISEENDTGPWLKTAVVGPSR
jgi:hypothetical protein